MITYQIQCKTNYGSYFSEVKDFEDEQHFTNYYFKMMKNRLKIIGVNPFPNGELIAELLGDKSLTLNQLAAQCQARLDTEMNAEAIEIAIEREENIEFLITDKQIALK